MPPQPLLFTTTQATPIPMLSTETEIFRRRRSIITLLFNLLVISAAGLGLYRLALSLGLSGSVSSLLLPAILVVVLFVDLVIFLDWLTTIYLLTNKRVQFRFGIIGAQTKTIALLQITDTIDKISIIGRLFNFGDVVIEAANINSQIVFKSVTDPSGTKDQIDNVRLG